MFTKRKSLGVVGIVSSTIGAVTLPEDPGTWWSRLTTVGEMVVDNPLSGIAIIVGLALLV
jgi:hypothetical protein